MAEGTQEVRYGTPCSQPEPLQSTVPVPYSYEYATRTRSPARRSAIRPDCVQTDNIGQFVRYKSTVPVRVLDFRRRLVSSVRLSDTRGSSYEIPQSSSRPAAPIVETGCYSHVGKVDSGLLLNSEIRTRLASAADCPPVLVDQSVTLLCLGSSEYEYSS